MLDSLHRACRLNEVDTLRNILDCHPHLVNTPDPKLGWTPLYRAVMCGHTECVECLLQHSASPNIKNRQGETPLHQATSSNHAEIVKLLLQYNADPNCQQIDGDTPLHFAVDKGLSDISSLLIQHQADVNRQSFVTGRTPLYLAIEQGRNSMTKNLQSSMHKFKVKDESSSEESMVSENPQEPEKELEVEEKAYESNVLYCWLGAQQLESTFWPLFNRGYEDLAGPIQKVKAQHPEFTIEGLKNLGIKRTGDRHRLLAALSNEAWPTLYKSCNSKYATLRQWLTDIKLPEKEEVFHNEGFNDFMQVLTVMKSKSPLTLTVLERDMGIQDKKTRIKILNSLQVESRRKSQKTSKASSEACANCAVM